MDAHKIAVAASDIKQAELALTWLSAGYFNDSASLPKFNSNGVATSCTGYSEAYPYLTDALRKMLPQIIDLAERTARENIANAKAIIAKEVASDE